VDKTASFFGNAPPRRSTELLELVNPTLRALLIGCAVEATLGALFAVAGFGPCGPSNPIGYIGMIGHLPGVLLVAPWASALKVPDSISTVLVVIAQVTVFSVIAFLIYRRKGTRRTI